MRFRGTMPAAAEKLVRDARAEKFEVEVVGGPVFLAVVIRNPLCDENWATATWVEGRFDQGHVEFPEDGPYDFRTVKGVRQELGLSA